MSCPYAEPTLAALRRFNLDDTYRRVVSYGVHAGFPACCIYFYTRIWLRWGGEIPALFKAANHDPDEATRRRLWEVHPEFMRALDEKFAYIDDSGWDIGYVRCPWCVVNGHRVPVRSVDVAACDCWP